MLAQRRHKWDIIRHRPNQTRHHFNKSWQVRGKLNWDSLDSTGAFGNIDGVMSQQHGPPDASASDPGPWMLASVKMTMSPKGIHPRKTSPMSASVSPTARGQVTQTRRQCKKTRPKTSLLSLLSLLVKHGMLYHWPKTLSLVQLCTTLAVNFA